MRAKIRKDRSFFFFWLFSSYHQPSTFLLLLEARRGDRRRLDLLWPLVTSRNGTNCGVFFEAVGRIYPRQDGNEWLNRFCFFFFKKINQTNSNGLKTVSQFKEDISMENKYTGVLIISKKKAWVNILTQLHFTKNNFFSLVFLVNVNHSCK